MPTKIEKDAITGRYTTGHEWDGLQELNTPLPKWWLYVFFACIAVAFVQFVLYPSWPYFVGHTYGLTGYTARAQVEADVKALQAQRAVFMDKIAKLPIEDVVKDPQLLAIATVAGRITFANNCQPCHGPAGEGRIGFAPTLAGDSWLWGGKLTDIEQTVTHGIRSADGDARQSQMPKFGADGMLKPEEIQAVADYVATVFFGTSKVADTSKGAQIYADNCVACHGANGEGNRDVGAPALKSHIHLYGDTRELVVAQVTNPRMGVMPNWNGRLDDATIKSVAIYVHSLGGGE